MRLAVQDTLIPGTSFSEKVASIERYGFDGVEVFGRSLPERFEEIQTALSSSTLRFSTVCGAPGDLLGPDRASREQAIESLKEQLRMCAQLGGIGVIIVPTFREPKIPDLYPWHPDVWEIEKQILIKECEILGAVAQNVGVSLLLEPINRYETHFLNRLDQAVEICEAVGIERVQVMADFFHMNIEEADLESTLENASKHVAHIHLADSNRLLPGLGHLDFKSLFQVLKRVGYTKYLALECRVPGDPETELPKCVQYLKQFLK